MAEKTFKSPNFFEREIEINQSAAQAVPVGTPVGVIGTSERGPAFVPVTLATFQQFQETFGDLHQNKPATYAVRQFLNNRNSGMFLRVLGAGANETLEDIAATELSGTVKNAGFSLPSGKVVFLNAIHVVQSNEILGDRSFTDNNSIIVSSGAIQFASLNRAVLMLPDHVTLRIYSSSTDLTTAVLATASIASQCVTDNELTLVLSSSNGSTFSADNGIPGAKIFNISLDPSSEKYIGKALNTDPTRINTLGHYLHLHFPVDAAVASVKSNTLLTGSATTQPEFAIFSGSLDNTNSLDMPFDDVFRKFDTRYNFAKSTKYISQPFGTKEYDLFHFESVDDGVYGNAKIKITITDLRLSLDEGDKYPTFSVQIRDMGDTDYEPKILEEFRNLNLNPDSSNYIARRIGNRRITFNFDSEDTNNRRLITSGKFLNQSKFVRVVPSNAVEEKLIPETAMPFGFRGLELLNTGVTVCSTSSLNSRFEALSGSTFLINVSTSGSVSADVGNLLTNGIIPPIPYRLKITRGTLTSSLGPTQIQGTPSLSERVVSNLCWGVKFEKTEDLMNPNSSLSRSEIIDNFSKFMGIKKLDALLDSSDADSINNNKFSLSKVALGFESIGELTSSIELIKNNMKSAVYFRDSVADVSDSFKLVDKNNTNKKLISFATLISDVNVFNQYSQFMKFSSFMYGGFDGINILDKDLSKLNDRSTSVEIGGCAEDSYQTPGIGNISGVSVENSAVTSYKTAINIMTDPFVINHNIFAIPGIRDSLITDYASTKIKNYGLSIYVMDLPAYDDSLNRLFEDSTTRPDIDKTVQTFQNRFIDNNYVCTYFPEIFIDDALTGKRIKLPASVGALGALSFNDRVSNPWFAPAGFNRASLDFVKNVTYRLTTDDRNKLYEARINPIAIFPRQGFVIYGQKTLQISKSSLDRVNVRRLLLEIKKGIIRIANELVFEINNQETRSRFLNGSQSILNVIKQQSGIEKFQIVFDEAQSNEQTLACRVIVIPIRSIEFIAIDFIITPSGVQFV